MAFLSTRFLRVLVARVQVDRGKKTIQVNTVMIRYRRATGWLL